MKVLVLCTGNSCRSQMAEAYLRLFAGKKVEVFSAGIEAHGLNPYAMKTLQDDGINIFDHSSETVEKYEHIQFDHVITVCDHAAEVCPHFNNATQRHHHNFPDPAKFRGNADETEKEFKKVREMIKAYCKDFSGKYLKIPEQFIEE